MRDPRAFFAIAIVLDTRNQPDLMTQTHSPTSVATIAPRGGMSTKKLDIPLLMYFFFWYVVSANHGALVYLTPLAVF